MVSNSKLLSPGTPERYNQFGNGVDISPDGRSAVVGEHRITWADRIGGNAYYFPSLTSAGEKLPPGDPSIQNAYGRSVALSDDGSTVVIGAPWDDNVGIDSRSHGAAYVYTMNGGWTLQQKLVEPVPMEYEYFGDSVDISDNGKTIIIGHPGDGNGIGAAHIYERSGATWVLQQKFSGYNGKLAFFGTSVALSGDGNTAIVGNPHPHYLNEGWGSAYVFVRSGSVWTLQSSFTPFDRSVGDNFGHAVDLSDDGNTALVGAYQKGAAYIFVRSNGNWSQQGQLLAPDKFPGDWFGNSVSLSNNGNIAVVGAVMANAAYLFSRQGTAWSFQHKLSSNDSNTYALGSAVAVSDDGQTVLVGDDEYTVSGTLAQGAVFIFRPYIPMPGTNLLLLK